MIIKLGLEKCKQGLDVRPMGQRKQHFPSSRETRVQAAGSQGMLQDSFQNMMLVRASPNAHMKVIDLESYEHRDQVT